MTSPCCAQCAKPLATNRPDRKTDLCRHCWSVKSLDHHRPRATPAQKADARRRRYLPAQLEATRRKLVMLEREAKRLGVEA